MKKIYILLVVFALFATACNSNKVPKDAKKVEPIEQKTTVKGNYTLSNFSLSIPETWQEQAASNSMRVAEFVIKKYPDYPIVVSYLGNNDNMIQANIDRWRGQFSLEDSYTELELTQPAVKGTKILGTYKLKAFPMAQDFTDTPSYGMLAAIIPSEEGPYFLKVTAPENVIQEETETFVKVLNSYQVVK